MLAQRAIVHQMIDPASRVWFHAFEEDNMKPLPRVVRLGVSVPHGVPTPTREWRLAE